MRQYRPKSYSVQARELSNKVYGNVMRGEWTEQEACEFFSNSYRCPLVVHRAAKRFGRLMRKEG